MVSKVLVTGGTGFIGRHLTRHLTERGCQVRALTRRDVDLGAAVEVFNVGDFTQGIDWSRYLDGVDAVVHLAALAHAPSSVPESEFDKVNRACAVQLARAASAANVRLVFVSSAGALAGSSADQLLLEDSEPRPTTPYGRAKLRAEQEMASVCKQYVILRPCLTYGAGVRGNMERILKLATLRVPPPFGAIHNKRSLLAVENLCDVISLVMTSPAAVNESFLVADAEPVSMAEIVSLLREGAGLSPAGLAVPPVILSQTLRLLGKGDLWRKIGGDLVLSVSKLEAFGFQWRVRVQDGLRRLAATKPADLERLARIDDAVDDARGFRASSI